MESSYDEVIRVGSNPEIGVLKRKGKFGSQHTKTGECSVKTRKEDGHGKTEKGRQSWGSGCHKPATSGVSRSWKRQGGRLCW